MISTLQYPCASTFTPTRVLVEFKRIVTDFLWSGKRSKTAYGLMIEQIEAVGLKLVDLETRLYTFHLSLIRRMWVHPTSLWGSAHVNALCMENIEYTIISKVNLASRLPLGYPTFRQILKTWAKFHLYSPQMEEVQEEALWDNDNINMAKKPVVWES